MASHKDTLISVHIGHLQVDLLHACSKEYIWVGRVSAPYSHHHAHTTTADVACKAYTIRQARARYERPSKSELKCAEGWNLLLIAGPALMSISFTDNMCFHSSIKKIYPALVYSWDGAGAVFLPAPHSVNILSTLDIFYEIVDFNF